VLVKYYEFVHEFDTDNLYTDGLFVLLRGKATVSSVGQSLIINAKPGCDLEAQHVLGQNGSCDISTLTSLSCLRIIDKEESSQFTLIRAQRTSS